MTKLGETAGEPRRRRGRRNSQAKGLVSDRTLERRKRTEEVNLSGKRTGHTNRFCVPLYISCIQNTNSLMKWR